MRSALTLTWTYFAATRLTQGLAALGFALLVTGVAGYALTSATIFNSGVAREFSSLEMSILAMPWLGLVLILAATALLPKIVEQICRGRGAWTLPGGRLSVLLSTILTAGVLASMTAIGATVAFLDFPVPIDLARVFYRTLLMAFIDIGLIYAAIWLVGKTSGIWRLVGLIGVVVAITIPLRYIGSIPRFTPLEGLGLASWLAFGALVLSGGRLRHALNAVRTRIANVARRTFPHVGYAEGTEVALLLGTTRPWVVAIGQVVPIAAMFWFVKVPSIWIVFLATFSAISGAISSQAAARSRRLWLRYDWTRAQIHSRVESGYWQYSAWSLSVLVLIYLALSIYSAFELPAIVLGTSLIALGSIASLYLGLTLTRSLGWFESALAILTMVALTLGAFAIIREQWPVAVQLQVLLAVLAVIFRSLGRSRWLALDWMRCRPG